VATIYSQLSYHEEDLDDQERIAYWSELYGQHLAKWLVLEDFTIQKTVLRYEGMRHDLVTEFEKVVNHFGESLNSEHLKEAEARVSKEEVKRKTQHDLHVIQLKSEYRVKREAFRKHWGSVIWDIMLAGRPYLREYFP